jgi:hypothetical protein
MRKVESGGREREGEPWSGAGYHHPSRAFLATSEKNQRKNQGDCPLAWGTVCGQGGICLFFSNCIDNKACHMCIKENDDDHKDWLGSKYTKFTKLQLIIKAMGYSKDANSHPSTFQPFLLDYIGKA